VVGIPEGMRERGMHYAGAPRCRAMHSADGRRLEFANVSVTYVG